MPEGDTIFNLAARIAPHAKKCTVQSFESRHLPRSATDSLVGRTIRDVRSHGKNLLIEFDDDRMLQIHLRMRGRLGFERPRSAYWQPLRTPPCLRIALARAHARDDAAGTAAPSVNAPHVVLSGHHLAIVRLYRTSDTHRSGDLARLGPDLLSPSVNIAECIQRIKRAARDNASIAEILLRQDVIAGIGNEYKSELLFLERIDPRTPAAALPEPRLESLLSRAVQLMRANVATPHGRRITRRSLTGPQNWVYQRAGRPCLVCATPISRIYQGPGQGRSTYACFRCQS